jgi:asparagine synthase (glutamine-hydrolysing)
MCGIAGALDPIGDRAAQRVRLLNGAQEHRGPDHTAMIRVGDVTLGNTRLAIQDPTPAGNQPFVSAGGRYTCVFNGEIYNHRCLVERYHLPTRTGCDGEVIPYLWAKLGVESLAELRGMFAIALWDSLAERLYLARDPFGIKPLYWRVLPDGSLAFSSEVRPLARVAAGARINPAAIARYLHLGAMAAEESPFCEIKALPPDSVAIFGRGCRETVRPILPGGPLDAPREPANLGPALLDSIELHLGADVPTALLLSAGIDSATICAVSRRLGRDLDCLTVAAGGAADETAGAARTAGHYGHRFRQVPARLADGDVAAFFAAMQRPSIDGLNSYLIFRAVHEAGFKVALSGLGGDEVVGGYSHFRLLRFLPALRALDAMPSPVSRAAAQIMARAGLAGTAKAARLLDRGGPRNGMGLALLQREVLPGPLVAGLTGVPDRGLTAAPVPAAPVPAAPVPAAAPQWPPASFGAMAAAEVAIYLQAMLLADADTFSMASSVELRVPFVDTHVFGASLAAAAHMRARPGKAAIGAALDDPYLRGLATAAKRGFSVPMGSWLAGPLAPVLHAASEPDAAVWSVIDPVPAKRAGLFPLRPRDRWSETWALAALNAWLESVGTGHQGQRHAGA